MIDEDHHTIGSNISVHGSLQSISNPLPWLSDTSIASTMEESSSSKATFATKRTITNTAVLSSNRIFKHLPDMLEVQKILRTPSLKQYYPTVYVTSEQLVEALLQFPDSLREFVRQLRHYRHLARPYLYEGCADNPIDDAFSQMTSSTTLYNKLDLTET